MRLQMRILGVALTVLSAGCATPPSADPSTVDSGCAQQCSSSLATCSAGFKMFPIVQQKQCNDNYDVCIKGCPSRIPASAVNKQAAEPTAERLRKLEDLYKSGAITKDEYEAKRKEILSSL